MCLTFREEMSQVSIKKLEELLFLERISYLLGAVAFDDVNCIFRA